MPRFLQEACSQTLLNASTFWCGRAAWHQCGDVLKATKFSQVAMRQGRFTCCCTTLETKDWRCVPWRFPSRHSTRGLAFRKPKLLCFVRWRFRVIPSDCVPAQTDSQLFATFCKRMLRPLEALCQHVGCRSAKLEHCHPNHPRNGLRRHKENLIKNSGEAKRALLCSADFCHHGSCALLFWC